MDTRRWTLTLLGLVACATLAFGGEARAESEDLAASGATVLDGAAAGFASGYSAPAGDVNGDGRADLIVLAQGAGFNDRPKSGSAYVVFGSPALRSLDLAALTPAQGFRIDGTPLGAFPYDALRLAAGAGDVNGDGYADVVLGRPYADTDGRQLAGSAWVVFGSRSPADVDLATLGPAQGFRIYGGEYWAAGSGAKGAGDLNDDGRADLVLSSAKGLHVIYGSSTPTTIDLSTLTADQGFTVNSPASFATSAPAGDVNGDGRDDLLIGLVEGGSTDAAVVLFGSATIPASIDLAALAPAQGFRISADTGPTNEFGSAVAGAGDVNGDGRADLLIGAPRTRTSAHPDVGAAYVIFGAASPGTIDVATMTPEQGARITGGVDGGYPGSGNQFGSAVAGPGDVDGDGRADLLVGAAGGDFNERSGAGSAYVLYGSPSLGSLDLEALSPEQGYRIDGAAAGDQAAVVAAPGDLDGDGAPEMVVGAPNASARGRAAAGKTYITSFAPTVAYAPVSGVVGQRVDASPSRLRWGMSPVLTIAPALPDGLAFNRATGRIKGTPTSAGTSTHTLTVTDDRGSGSATFGRRLRPRG